MKAEAEQRSLTLAMHAAKAAAKFASTEARAQVRTLLIALHAGAPDVARRQLDHYVQRIAFVGAPSIEVQVALRRELALAYRAMTAEQRSDFDAIFGALRSSHPNAWIAERLPSSSLDEAG